jgi:transcriptional antiterminator NusG
MPDSPLPPDAVSETLPSGAPVPPAPETETAPAPAPVALTVEAPVPAPEPAPPAPEPAPPTPDVTVAAAVETPVEAPPAAEATPAVEEAPAEEAPADEAPADEAPADGAPADEAPADEALAAEEEPAPPVEVVPPPPENKKRWYVVKVQSGREDSIKEAIERKVKIEGLQEFFGQICIPTETQVEMRNNRRVTRHLKKFPGYLMAEVEYNDRILYLFRETSGVGDFVGGSITRAPQPMTQAEVDRMLGVAGAVEPDQKTIKVKRPKYERGDRLRVRSGTFAGMEGEVLEILEDKAHVKLQVTIFGRPADIELEYAQVEPL